MKMNADIKLIGSDGIAILLAEGVINQIIAVKGETGGYVLNLQTTNDNTYAVKQARGKQRIFKRFVSVESYIRVNHLTSIELVVKR